MGDSHVGLQARLMSQALRKLAGTLNRTDTICIFTNQLREKIGVMFGNPETTPGGRALKFYSSVRLDIRRIETLKDGVEAFGNRVRVKVVKNKVAPPFKQAEFDIIYGSGIPWEGTLLDTGIDRKIVQKSGSFFSFEDERLGQGRQNATAFLREHPDLGAEDPREAPGRRRARPGRLRAARVAAGSANGDAPAAEEQADEQRKKRSSPPSNPPTVTGLHEARGGRLPSSWTAVVARAAVQAVATPACGSAARSTASAPGAGAGPATRGRARSRRRGLRRRALASASWTRGCSGEASRASDREATRSTLARAGYLDDARFAAVARSRARGAGERRRADPATTSSSAASRRSSSRRRSPTLPPERERARSGARAARRAARRRSGASRRAASRRSCSRIWPPRRVAPLDDDVVG